MKYPIDELVVKVSKYTHGPMLSSHAVAIMLMDILKDEPNTSTLILEKDGAEAQRRYDCKRSLAQLWSCQEHMIHSMGFKAKEYIYAQPNLIYSTRFKKDKDLSIDIWLSVVRMMLLHSDTLVSVHQASKLVDAPYSPSIIASHYKQVNEWLLGSSILDSIDHSLYGIRQTTEEMLSIQSLLKLHPDDEKAVWRGYMKALAPRRMRERRAKH